MNDIENNPEVNLTADKIDTVGLAYLIRALNRPCTCEPGHGTNQPMMICTETEPLDRSWYQKEFN